MIFFKIPISCPGKARYSLIVMKLHDVEPQSFEQSIMSRTINVALITLHGKCLFLQYNVDIHAYT